MPDHPINHDAHRADNKLPNTPTGVTDETDRQPGIAWTLVDGEPTRTQVLYLDDETTLALQRLHRDRGRVSRPRLPRLLRRRQRAQLRQLERLLQMGRGHTPPTGSAR